MSRPPFEVADVIRKAGSRFREPYRATLTWPQVKVLNAIARCRTAALGGHRDQCSRCGHQTISYNSCRNRHCPKCQTNARDQWLAKRQQELLPVGYFHLVFSVPHALVPLMWQNKRRLFALLFASSAAALLEASVITSKAANGYHFKTGQRKWPSRTEIVLPCRLLWWQVGFGAPTPRAALAVV